MSGRKHHRWLDLAARSRQWTLDEQGPALLQARQAEDRAQALHEAHARSLAGAHLAQRELLSCSHFRAIDMSQQAAFEHAMRQLTQHSEIALKQARDEADEVREDMKQAMAERDAYRHRVDQLAKNLKQRQARDAVRQLDELWLLRRPPAIAEGSHED